MIEYELNVTAGTGGTVSGGGGLYTAGEEVSIEAMANSGYAFVNWTNDSDSSVVSTDALYSFSMPAEDISYTANFVASTFSIFREDFSGLNTGEIPTGWTSDRPNWGAVNSSTAGGESPEMRFSWTPTFNGVSRLISPEIDASWANGLGLNFKHYVDDFVGGYAYRVQVSTDGGTSWTSVWSVTPSGNIPAQTVVVNLSAYDGQTIKIAWVFDGNNSVYADYWYIDDIIVADN